MLGLIMLCTCAGKVAPLCDACRAKYEPIWDGMVDVLAEIQRVDGVRGLDLETALGTGDPHYARMAVLAEALFLEAAARGAPELGTKLLEETYEALAETDPARLYAELAQVAGVTLRMMRAVKARQSAG